MIINKDLHDKLKKDIGYKRYIHSIGVMETAMKLAKYYKVNEEQAKIAGLLHDCGKYENTDQILKDAYKFCIILDDVMEYSKGLVHGPLGGYLAKIHYGVDDNEILEAISFHTTGRKNMTLLDKIIYLADYIEPGRNFNGVDEVRTLAYKNLNKALIKSMDNTIKHVINKKYLLHKNTIDARNSLIIGG